MSGLNFPIYATDHATRVLERVGKSMGKLGKDTDGLKGRFLKFGAIAATGAAAAGTALAGLAVISVKAAAEDQASQAKLAQTLRKTTKATAAQVAATEAWVLKTELASGVADDELRPALAKLVIAGESVAKAQKHVALAMDISAATGKSLEAVTMAMAKAHNGNVGSLGRLGIATKNAAGETLTYNQILAQAQAKMGGAAANAANTFQGKMNRLKVAVHEAEESIGTALLPVLTTLVTWVVDKGIPALSKFAAWFSVHVMPAIRAVAAFVRDHLVVGVQSLRASLQQNKPQIDELIRGLKTVASWIMKYVAPALRFLYDKEFKGLFLALKGAINWIGYLVTAFNEMRTAVIGEASAIATAFKSAFNFIASAWNNTIGKLWFHHFGIDFDVPDIPMMAKGGIVTKPTLAMIGEAGPEAVVPLSGRRGGVGGTHVTVNVQGALNTDRQIADAIVKALKSRGNVGAAFA